MNTGFKIALKTPSPVDDGAEHAAKLSMLMLHNAFRDAYLRGYSDGQQVHPKPPPPISPEGKTPADVAKEAFRHAVENHHESEGVSGWELAANAVLRAFGKQELVADLEARLTAQIEAVQSLAEQRDKLRDMPDAAEALRRVRDKLTKRDAHKEDGITATEMAVAAIDDEIAKLGTSNITDTTKPADITVPVTESAQEVFDAMVPGNHYKVTVAGKHVVGIQPIGLFVDITDTTKPTKPAFTEEELNKIDEYHERRPRCHIWDYLGMTSATFLEKAKAGQLGHRQQRKRP